MMTKDELIAGIAEQTGHKKVDTKLFLESLGNVIQETLSRGDEVVLPKLGKLSTVLRDSRSGRNPITGEKLTIPSHKAVKFKPLKELKDALA